MLYGSGEYDQRPGLAKLLKCINKLIQFISGVEQSFNKHGIITGNAVTFNDMLLVLDKWIEFFAARIFYHRDIKVAAVSDVSGGLYKKSGLDITDISDYLETKGNLLKDYNAPGVEHITNEELLTCECDVLIPAALENQITAEVAEKVKCSYIIEAANGPTSEAGDVVLENRGIPVIPDIFANCGGVIVSYFEWVQNIQELTWSRERVNEMLADLMSKAFMDILSVKKECDCTFRMAAYIVALRKLVYAEEIKGIFP